MTSIVLELQRQALNPASRVSDVLRTALLVATKLEIQEFQQWCERELHGYTGSDVPAYRKIQGEIRAWNPARGWMPIRFQSAKLADSLAKRVLAQPLAELEHHVTEADEGDVLVIPFSPQVLAEVFANSEQYQLGIEPTVVLGRAQLTGVLDSVRNTVLEWSLRLEKEGILGNGLAFSQEEQRRAEAITYNIQNFAGVLGSVHSSSVQVGDYNSIHKELKRRGVPQEERNELEEIMDEMPQADAQTKVALVRRGTEWLMRNSKSLGELSDTIREWFQQVGP